MATWGGYDGNILATRFQKTFIKDYLDLSGSLDVRNYDVSLNNRLFVMNDASFMGNMYINGNLTANIFVANNDVTLNNRLFVLNDASFMSNVYVNNILTVNLNLISNGDASLNSNVSVAKDISCNGNVSIGRNLTINGNLAVQNYTSQNIINTTTTNYQLVVSEDLSLNGRLAVSNDVSMNGNLFVFRDISLNGNIRINGASFLKDIAINSINIGIKNSIYNTVVGNLALGNVTTGINNTAVGIRTLGYNTSGSNNTVFGAYTMGATTVGTGSNNTAIGLSSLSTNTSGGNNTAFGQSAGSTILTTETNNTYIGYSTGLNTASSTNSSAIGYDSRITGSNQIVLGRVNETVIIPRITRHLAPPIIMRKATSSQTQLARWNTDTTVLFPTSVYDNGNTGITYSNGFFTNTNSYSVCVHISVSVNTPPNTSRTRYLSIFTKNNSSVTAYTTSNGEERHAVSNHRGLSVHSSQHLTGMIPLANGAYFYINYWQNTDPAVDLSLNMDTTYPTCISIYVF
jgi:hypothetical protein